MHRYRVHETLQACATQCTSYTVKHWALKDLDSYCLRNVQCNEEGYMLFAQYENVCARRSYKK